MNLIISLGEDYTHYGTLNSFTKTIGEWPGEFKGQGFYANGTTDTIFALKADTPVNHNGDKNDWYIFYIWNHKVDINQLKEDIRQTFSNYCTSPNYIKD